MFSLKELFAIFNSMSNPVSETNNRLKLYNTALQCLGKDASPNDVAPDEYGCAETVNAIHKMAFGSPIGGDISTYRLYDALKKSNVFVKVDRPLEGDIIISPTGYGNGSMPSGHVGIMGTINNNDINLSTIMSNTSKTGIFLENYTLAGWKVRYREKGGYPVEYWRRV